MKVLPTDIEGLRIIEPERFGDRRGFFLETYRQQRYAAAGISAVFIQDNLSFSVQHTLRGLHFQIRHPQAKLVQAITGEVFDVAVDLRPGSKTFGKWAGILLSGDTGRQVFIPEGFAHGFCVLSPTAHFLYKCSAPYAPADEGGILWCDPDIDIRWPVSDPIISDKDRGFPRLCDLKTADLPHVEAVP